MAPGDEDDVEQVKSRPGTPSDSSRGSDVASPDDV